MADAEQAALQHSDGPGEAWLGQAGEVFDRFDDCGGGLVSEPQDHNAGVAAGRIGADVAQADVQ
jgi:hypothetical protein